MPQVYNAGNRSGRASSLHRLVAEPLELAPHERVGQLRQPVEAMFKSRSGSGCRQPDRLEGDVVGRRRRLVRTPTKVSRPELEPLQPVGQLGLLARTLDTLCQVGPTVDRPCGGRDAGEGARGPRLGVRECGGRRRRGGRCWTVKLRTPTMGHPLPRLGWT